MTRKITSMAFALVAVLALGAVMASGAMAAEFHAEKTSTTITGKQTTTHSFTAGSGGFGAINCSTASFSGTTSATKTTTTEQAIKPSYSGCKDSFGRTAHVAVNKCEYIFTSIGTVHIENCAAGKPITVTITGFFGGTECTVTIDNQTGINGQTYHNGTGANGKKDITETTKATNIKTNTTSSGGLGCGIANGAHSDGTYTGTTTLEGSSGISFS